MPIHYIPLRALRLCCRWAAERCTPLQTPVVISRPYRENNSEISLLAKDTD